MKRHLARLVLALVCLLAARSAHAEDVPGATDDAATGDPAKLFESAVTALAKDSPTEAIQRFEALGDHGVQDPVASYDRGLAYAARVRAGGNVPGDLGRAVHGFEEARDLTRDPALARDAGRALAEVRAEIARRRAHAGESIELEHGSSLGRTIPRLLEENVWAVLALLFSLASCVGIVVRGRASSPRAKVAGNTICAVGGGLMVLASLALYAARDLRLHVREGVIVTDGTRLLDDRHQPLDAARPIPEGTRVELRDDRQEFPKIAVFGLEGHVAGGSVLPLAKR